MGANNQVTASERTSIKIRIETITLNGSKQPSNTSERTSIKIRIETNKPIYQSSFLADSSERTSIKIRIETYLITIH